VIVNINQSRNNYYFNSTTDNEGKNLPDIAMARDKDKNNLDVHSGEGKQFLDAKLKKSDSGKITGFFKRLTSCQPNSELASCFMNKRKSREP
jgi:hypothetical protein